MPSRVVHRFDVMAQSVRWLSPGHEVAEGLVAPRQGGSATLAQSTRLTPLPGMLALPAGPEMRQPGVDLRNFSLSDQAIDDECHDRHLPAGTATFVMGSPSGFGSLLSPQMSVRHGRAPDTRTSETPRNGVQPDRR